MTYFSSQYQGIHSIHSMSNKKDEFVNVRIHRDVHRELSKFGDLSATYSEVIADLIRMAKSSRRDTQK
jgi:hypothetical protein